MKKVLFLLLLMISTITFAQESKTANVVTANATTTNVSETERIVDKYTGKIEGVITSLAKSLQVPAEHVYKVMVMQEFAQGVSIISNIILLFIFSWGFFKVLPKTEDWDFDVIWSWVCIGLLIGLVFEFLIVIISLEPAIIKMVNPEYGAIKDIIELLNPKSK